MDPAAAAFKFCFHYVNKYQFHLLMHNVPKWSNTL